MNTTKSCILVPTDFSKVAESAAAHASVISRQTSDTIHLLHVITKEKQSEIKKNPAVKSQLERKIEELAADFSQKYKANFVPVLREGSIFTTIGEYADEIQANLVVLGTHGVVGVQKLVGAYALKVVGSSKVPVVIVQDKHPSRNAYEHIVSPIDASTETKQKTLQTISMAKIFNSKVYLYKQKGFDDYLTDVINLNLNFVTRYLKEHQIEFEVVEQEKFNKDFASDFLAYSKSIEADLIIILTTTDKSLKEMILGPVEQEVINNAHEIPVMCVNPLQNIYKSERLASMVNMSL